MKLTYQSVSCKSRAQSLIFRGFRPEASGDTIGGVSAGRRTAGQPGILSMKPTIEASLPSVDRVAKSTPSTTDGPAAGPSDQAKRTALLWLSTLEMRFSTKPGNLAWTPASMASRPAWPVAHHHRIAVAGIGGARRRQSGLAPAGVGLVPARDVAFDDGFDVGHYCLLQALRRLKKSARCDGLAISSEVITGHNAGMPFVAVPPGGSIAHPPSSRLRPHRARNPKTSSRRSRSCSTGGPADLRRLLPGPPDGRLRAPQASTSKFSETQGAVSSAAMIGEGKEFWIGSSSGIATAIGRSKGQPIKSLAVYYQKSPTVIFTRTEDRIAHPRDLYGKTLGLVPGSITNEELRALLAANKLDRSKIKETTVEWNAYDLVEKKVDALIDYDEMAPAELIAEGRRITMIRLSDFGVRAYSLNLIVNDAAWADPAKRAIAAEDRRSGTGRLQHGEGAAGRRRHALLQPLPAACAALRRPQHGDGRPAAFRAADRPSRRAPGGRPPSRRSRQLKLLGQADHGRRCCDPQLARRRDLGRVLCLSRLVAADDCVDAHADGRRARTAVVDTRPGEAPVSVSTCSRPHRPSGPEASGPRPARCSPIAHRSRSGFPGRPRCQAVSASSRRAPA